MPKPLLITIDGPAGAGKTTIARKVAGLLKYRYVDTGALYRVVAVAARDAGTNPLDDAALENLLKGLDIQMAPDKAGGWRYLANGIDVTHRLRTPEISMLASTVSAREPVRRFLLGIQRKLGKKKAAVFEGRDMGTVVFPNADLKFYLDADPGVRARRRFDETPPEKRTSLEQVRGEMEKRDADDKSRALAPLKPAPDAIVIDSTNLSVAQAAQKMLAHINR